MRLIKNGIWTMKSTAQQNRIKNIEYRISNIEKYKEDNSRFKIQDSRFCASGAGFTLIELLVVFSLVAWKRFKTVFCLLSSV